MKFLLLIVNANEDWECLSAEEQQRVVGEMNAFGDELKSSGSFVSCGGLAPGSDAKTVQLRNGDRVVVDGLARPLTEKRELVTGFFVVDVDSKDEAVECAKKLPIIAGGVEVRHIAAE